MKVVAIISIRNNYEYLKVLLEYLKHENIQVVLIDEDSYDGSEKIYNRYKNGHVLDVIKIPFSGMFSLKDHLQLKDDIRKTIDADWIIHHDSDEVMQSSVKGESLFDMIVRIDKQGFNTINLEEYVFLPEDERIDYTNRNFLKEMKFYYCFAPIPLRLNRIFKNDTCDNSISSGGHQIVGSEVNISPENMVLRHYIGLSLTKLKSKYKNRIFPTEELDKGWHYNRVNVDWDNIKIPDLDLLNFIPIDGINNLTPYSNHFWDWNKDEFHKDIIEENL